jgi:hypothetical protein
MQDQLQSTGVRPPGDSLSEGDDDMDWGSDWGVYTCKCSDFHKAGLSAGGDIPSLPSPDQRSRSSVIPPQWLAELYGFVDGDAVEIELTGSEIRG